MPPKPKGPRAMTPAERQAVWRTRREAREVALAEALRRVLAARTLREARQVAGEALAPCRCHATSDAV